MVANDTQLHQIQTEFESDCTKVGFAIPGGVYPCDANHNAVNVNKHRKAEVFVTTIQRVSSTNKRQDFDMLVTLLLSGGNWMLACDEFHHYATGNDWGIALNRLVALAKFTLATSATPDRDKSPTIFGKPILIKTYKDAHRETCVKQLQLRHFNYRVKVQNTKTGQEIEFTTEELRKLGGEWRD